MGHLRDDMDIFDRGLQDDLRTLLVNRRQALRMFGGVGLGLGLLGLAACAAEESTATTAGASVTTPTTMTTEGSCEAIPAETAGPYPGDGSNGPNVLTESGIVRRDIRSSVGSASGGAEGVALEIALTIQSVADACAPVTGAAVYLWHCDAQGGYSLYSDGITGENYLRGVQVADDDGIVRFTSIFPGCYPGRWPHAHFEVYPDLDAATSASRILATSQLALPQDVCEAVYADTTGYPQSAANLARLSLATDDVFGEDEGERQLGAITGSTAVGYVTTLTVPV